jgi:acetyl-CoA carboxylase, biotin carboxylase subunit
MIRKILIANRGEIAVRIMRTCREMGIRTVAVCSDSDANSLHGEVADEVVRLSGSSASETYLDQQLILSAAHESKADAIHPGYGFLSENADFAERVEQSGLIWVGPPSSAIRKMGSKTGARKLMKSAGVPIVPGTEVLRTADGAMEFAQSAGFPIILKASAGGGGKGMRIVRSREDIAPALDAARREAQSAFGDDAVYAEKYIENPRHIEVQIFADKFGSIIHLGERECTLQRRHQKIIEESPSPSVSVESRVKLGQAAINAARACGYVNAGTIEFLMNSTGEFYFLEMNTRLQVEHPVTEEVAGLDLVRLQLNVASGEKLGMTQEDVLLRGHAIETRIYAEDVLAGFLPATGKLSHLKPSSGPGIREDSGVRLNSEISRYYDPMLSKLVVHAENRAAAIQKMKRALEDYQIAGVRTTIPFCRHIISSKSFADGDFYTGSVESRYLKSFQQETKRPMPDEETFAAVLAMVRDREIFANPSHNGKLSSNGHVSAWKAEGREFQRDREI